MKKHLYLIRHGETLFNQRKKIQGWCDSPLTKKGIEQAQAAALLIKDINFDHYYSSTSERCCDTLEIITNHQVPYVRLKQLKERNFGYLEACDEDLVKNNSKGHFFDDIYTMFKGEYYHEVQERMVNILTSIMNKEDHHTVLAISHGASSFAFLSSFVDVNTIVAQGGIPNCAIVHITYEDGKFALQEIIKPNI